MEMPDSLAAAFNRQIALELESSTVYLQMSAFLAGRSLTGMAAWMRLQSEEERAHALTFLDYVLDRGNDVRLSDLPAPRTDYTGPLDVFRAALAHEQRVSRAIADLYETAAATDAMSLALLQGFLTEQVDEESTVQTIVDRLEIIGEDGGALLVLDRELGARTTSV